MNRISQVVLFLTVLLLLASGTASSPAPATPGLRVADGPGCIPTGDNSCPKKAFGT
jgi:hypothetical protein